LTPLESDTVFGHICWAMEYLGIFTGDKNVSRFLEKFNGPEPPLIISNAFPEGYLPFPLLPPMSKDEKKELENEFKEKMKDQTGGESNRGMKLEFEHCLKRYSRHKFVSLDTFFKHRHQVSYFHLYRDMVLDRFPLPLHEPQTANVDHNAIDRISGRVLEGMFFSSPATFYPPQMTLCIYLKTDFFTPGDLQAIFGYIGANGFGADKTTGHGRFDYELIEGLPFGQVNDFNAYLLLSNTNPSILDRHAVYYSARTKFGRVGGEYSMLAGKSPLKNPVVILEPGAIVKSGEPVEYLGENFHDIHPQFPGICHYGIGFPVPLRLYHET